MSFQYSMIIKRLTGFSPIRKPMKLPDRLIYHGMSKFPLAEEQDVYNMFSTKTGVVIGTMTTRPTYRKIVLSSYYPQDDLNPSLYIMDLHSYERGNHVGSSFINFAKIISKKSGLNGRLHLISSDVYDNECPPHVFYRKQGFTSMGKDLIKNIDNYLLGKPYEPIDFHSLRMYYNPDARVGEYETYEPPKLKLKDRINNFIYEFFATYF